MVMWYWYFLLVLYILLSVAIVVVGTQKLSPMGTGRAVIYAAGSLLVLLFFGLRWFSLPSTNLSWPPTINMCPDYLTFVPKITGSKSSSGGGCVDLLGVSTKASGIRTSNPSNLTTILPTDTSKLFEFTSSDVKAAMNNSKALQAICTRCQVTGLTWEGVYDGDTCVGLNRAKLLASTSNCPSV